MPTRASITLEDYSKEKTHSLFWVQDASAANFDSVRQDVDEIKDAILTVTLGEVRSTDITKTELESVALVTNKTAQREFKWEVTYMDIVQFIDDPANTVANPGYGKIFTTEIGTADPSLVVNNTDYMDITTVASVGLAFATALNANMRSPYNHTTTVAGNKVVVLSVKLKGKNT